MSGLAVSRPLLYLRAALFWVLFATSVVVFAVLLTLLRPFIPVRSRYRVGRLWSLFNVWWLKITCGLDFQVRGLDNLARDRAVVFMAKHQSTWETIALATLLPVHTYVLKRELMRIPFFGWGVAAMWPIAIDRSAGRKAVEQMVEQGRERIANGISVLVFPEGTRTRPGSATRYKMGGAILAEQSGCPVIPIAHNAGEYWPRHSFIKWPGRIELVVGPAIETAGLTPEQINERVREWIEAQMAQISNPALHHR